MKRFFWLGNQLAWWVALVGIIFGLGQFREGWGRGGTFSVLAAISIVLSMFSFAAFFASGLFAAPRWGRRGYFIAGAGCALASIVLSRCLPAAGASQGLQLLRLVAVVVLPCLVAPWWFRNHPPR